MEFPNRKTIRLPDYDYSTPGYYFITICTKNKKQYLSKIDVGTGLPDGPENTLTEYGKFADNQIQVMDAFYDNISVDKYCIMPNHIHILLQILQPECGPSGRPVPTNSVVSKFVGTFKRFCNRHYGENIWQSRSFDHIIRGKEDYLNVWSYIDNNAAKWTQDCFYMKD